MAAREGLAFMPEFFAKLRPLREGGGSGKGGMWLRTDEMKGTSRGSFYFVRSLVYAVRQTDIS